MNNGDFLLFFLNKSTKHLQFDGLVKAWIVAQEPLCPTQTQFII